MATVEELKKELFYKPQHASVVIEDDEVAKADAFAEDYKKFLEMKIINGNLFQELLKLKK